MMHRRTFRNSTSKGKVLSVVLDGPILAGKSVLSHRFTNGEFLMKKPTVGVDCLRKSFTVEGIPFDVRINDIQGWSTVAPSDIGGIYRSTDVILVAFDISNPGALEHIFPNRFVKLHKKYQKPILLVGLKSDLRQELEYKDSLFPYEYGACLAHLLGAIKYMECSSKTNEGVKEVFEEAIRASFERGYGGIVDDKLKRLIHSKINVPMNEKWKSIIEEVITTSMCPTLESELSKQLKSIDQQFCQALSGNDTDVLVSCSGFSHCRTLDIDTFRLANYNYVLADFTRFKFTERNSILWSSERLNTMTGSISDLAKFAKFILVMNTNISLRFVSEDCSSINSFLSSIRSTVVKSLVIINCTGTLQLNFLSTLGGLQNLIIINTAVGLDNLSFSSNVISSLKSLVLNECHTDIPEIPTAIGVLSQLEVLDVTCSSFRILPESLCLLDSLHTLRCNHDQVMFPPKYVLQKPAQEILQYLKAFHEESSTRSTYREAKVMVLGQEGVGKSTLVKSLKRNIWIFKTHPPGKTDGVDISVLPLQNYDCKVYDLAGDVEYLNTHALFFSPNCLHLAVFDLSRYIVSQGIRSSDLFSRLELWLQTIACQDQNSYGIIVGTRMDHRMLSPEVLSRIREHLNHLLDRYRPCHLSTLDKIDGCLLCNKVSDYQEEGILGSTTEAIGIAPQESNGNAPRPSDTPSEEGISSLEKSDTQGINQNTHVFAEDTELEAASIILDTSERDVLPDDIFLEEAGDNSQIPHIFGIFEVSGITNKNVKRLKRQIQSSIGKIKKYTNTEHMPRKWLVFRDAVRTRLSQSEDLAKQPIFKISEVYNLAYESQIINHGAIAAMLRFFHSQGVFLWYEDIPDMKNVVILDPQWLSDQLKTLVSHLPNVDAICEGVLHHSKLPVIWSNTSEENRSRLINLFRNVGLCFSVSEMEDLFPCRLPVGWPDREMWPSIPKSNERQTSLLFTFSFVSPSFFPDLIVAINEKRESFPSHIQPLYYRFNVVYITKDEFVCPLHNEVHLTEITGEMSSRKRKQEPVVNHRIHFELMPHKNMLKVSIRGSRPCCMIPDIETTIEKVKSRRYPGMTYSEKVVCPECEMKKLHSPSTLDLDDSHDGFCQKGHSVGCIDDVLTGKMSSSDLIPSAVTQVGRTMGEVLEDHFCPKLFAVLPINVSSLSLKERFVYSYLRDGYAVHLLCESPEEWHFVSSPGFRVGRPKEFFKTYGGRVCKLLRVISTLGTPFKIASPAGFDPNIKVGAAVAHRVDKMNAELKALLDDYLVKYPHLKSSLGSPKDDLKDLKSSGGLRRSELSRFLEVSAKGRDFGPLTCTHVDKCNEWLWLCEEHNKKYSIVER